MAIKELENLRKQYPQYEDLPDEELASRLVSRYPQYGDLLEKSTNLGTPISRLPFAQKAFLPSTLPREFVGNQVTQGLKTTGEAVRATPVGKALEFLSGATKPYGAMQPIPTTMDFVSSPEMVGQLVGQAADPLSYVGFRAASRTGRTVGEIPDFLKGNPKKIKRAEDLLNQKAHETVKALRPGGRLHNKVFETIKNESERAWTPMRRVANAIDGEIPIQELRQSLTQKINDPGRLQASMVVLDDLEKSQQAFTAPELVDLSSRIGGFMKKAAIKGSASRSFDDIVYSDIRTAIGDILEFRAPPELKGSVALAKQQWASYATDRDALFRYFSPAGSQNLPTARGASLLKRAALGNTSPYETEFLGRVQQSSGVDLPAEIQKYAKSVSKAQSQGRVGRGVSKAAPFALGIGYLSKYLPGRD